MAAIPPLNLRGLAASIARTPNDVDARQTQIRHWDTLEVIPLTASNLHIDLGNRHPGRGKSRAYPVDLVPWCRMLAELARRGISVQQMQMICVTLATGVRTNRKQRALFEAATTGAGDDVYLTAYDPFFGPDAHFDTPEMDGQAYHLEGILTRGPAATESDFAVSMNLSKAMAYHQPVDHNN